MVCFILLSSRPTAPMFIRLFPKFHTRETIGYLSLTDFSRLVSYPLTHPSLQMARFHSCWWPRSIPSCLSDHLFLRKQYAGSCLRRGRRGSIRPKRGIHLWDPAPSPGAPPPSPGAPPPNPGTPPEACFQRQALTPRVGIAHGSSVAPCALRSSSMLGFCAAVRTGSPRAAGVSQAWWLHPIC